jgi:hypothetical protein
MREQRHYWDIGLLVAEKLYAETKPDFGLPAEDADLPIASLPVSPIRPPTEDKASEAA